ncbi:hypothetical protein Droror1_Dr00023681 [Drosera rotundifolia]
MSPDFSTETLTLDPNPSPTKRPKTDPHLTIDFRFDDDDITLPRCCGICLSEEGTTIRGRIDCCDHCYCFLCIIDWAKMESRCPLCKCRFHGIRRVRRDGSEIGEREVVVPIRDQISNPDIDREESDPHAHVCCTVCHDSKDESLLLLCDLCDTAAHTYCVGLGVTVPEGDWFCEDCVTVRAELSNHETRADISLPTTPCPTKGVPPAKVQVSVFDIIKEPQEPRTSEIHRLLRWTHPRKCWTLSTISSNSANLGLAGEGRPAAKEFLTFRDEVVDSAVTVPNGCQNTYQNMRDLRENWAPFQCGTMSFSSSTLGASGKSSINLDTMSTDGSFDQASLPKENVTRNKDKQQYVVHKAWKLLKSAMSMQQAEKEHQASKVVSRTPLRKIGSSIKSKNHTASKSLPSKFKNQGSTRLKMRGDTSGGSLCERSKKKQHGSKRLWSCGSNK